MIPCTVSGTSTSAPSSRQRLAVSHEQAAILEHADVLLGEQRVPVCASQQRLLHLGRKHGLRELLGDQACGVLVGERPTARA